MKSIPKLGRKKRSSGPLTSILVPVPKEGKELEWYSITDGPTIEKVILERNRRHFSQAGETPLASEEIIELFGPGGDTKFAQNILDGSANLSEVTDNETTQLLLQLMKKEKTEEINFTIEDMMDRYKKWKEKTTTSPSGRHFGHYHALYRAFSYNDEDEKKEIEGMRNVIIQMHHLMLVAAMRNGFVYERWKTIVTQMIEKVPGCPKISRLRVIHLYECDLNLLFGICFRQLQQHNEDNQKLNEGCYGGRPNRRAIDPVIVDVTQTEIAMILRRALIRFQNDLCSCFDRIVSHLAQINNQSFGLPKEIAKIIGTFLHQAIYYIKTGMGVSKTGYKHTREMGVWGTGQGSVASMYIWGMLVSRQIQLHDMFNHGAKYYNYRTKQVLKVGMLSFVDDCNLSNTGEQYETLKDIL